MDRNFFYDKDEPRFAPLGSTYVSAYEELQAKLRTWSGRQVVNRCDVHGLILEPVIGASGRYRRFAAAQFNSVVNRGRDEHIEINVMRLSEAIRTSDLPSSAVLATSSVDPHVHLVEIV